MKHRNIIHIPAQNPPVVELDSEARAAYIRFSRKKVAETKVITEDKCLVTIDMDSNGEVVGVELVGVVEFGVEPLLKKAGITVPQPMLRGTSYVPAKFQPV